MANTLKVALFVLFSVGAFAQGGFYANFTWSVAAGSVPGQVATLVTQPGAAVHVCLAPANATPCTNYASIYSDSGLTTPITQPGYVSDSFGNFGFYASPGNFQYTVTYNGSSSGPYTLSIPAINPIFATAGVFTNTQMNIPVQSNVNSCSPTTEYQATELGNFATSPITGCVIVPNISTVHEADGLFGAVNVAGAATIGVGVRGQARCTVNNAICEGVVPVVEDTAGLTGHSMLGAEVDLPLNGSPTLLEGLRILTVNGGGSAPASSWGVHVLPLLAGGGGYKLLGGAFYSEDNISDTGLILGSKTVSANSDSQDLYFHTRDAGNVVRTLILRVPSSLVANRILEFGDPGGTDFVAYLAAAQTLTNKTLTSPTITTPTISGNITQSGVTAKVMQAIASGTAVMTTGAITTGTCGSTVTVAATGALTSDVIDTAAASAVSAPNGLLVLNKWVTANNVNFNYCNPTAGSLTPAALTINWLVSR